jgi:hypothetical protein
MVVQKFDSSASYMGDDKKFFVEKGDPGFSPERNKRVIEDTIKKYELQRAKKIKEFREGLAERSDALATWIGSLKGWKSGTPADRYFGRRMIAYLRGDALREKLMNGGGVISRDTIALASKLGPGKRIN